MNIQKSASDHLSSFHSADNLHIQPYRIDTGRFSLAEKIGQMVMIGFRGTEADESSPIIKAVKNHHLGGVWLTDNENEMGIINGNIRSPKQVRKLVSDLQASAEIPLFISIDAEGGNIIRLKEKYGFPPTLSAKKLGEADDPDLTSKQAGLIATMLSKLGINFNFAPVLDLDINKQNPALGKKERCFSDDPRSVVKHAEVIIEHHRKHGILCAAKHFPGHGSALKDSHHGFVDITDTWSENELHPYRTLIERGMPDAVITAHIFHSVLDSQYPATLSNPIINGMLRQQLGFEGIVISDDMNMGAIQYNYSYDNAVELAINAGVDIILQSNVDHYDVEIALHTIKIIENLVDSGRVPLNRIDESFQRIMKRKMTEK